MASAKYRLLRRLCSEKGIDGRDIAEVIGRTDRYVSMRMMGQRPWDQDEMYKVMDMLGQPYENMSYIFPLGGMYAGEIPEHKPNADELFGRAMRAALKEAGIA